MAEPDQIEFHEQVQHKGSRSRTARAGMIAGAGLIVLVAVVAAMGAAPSPATGADPTASGAPGASSDPGTVAPKRDRAALRGFRIGDLGGRPFKDITITGIDGSNVSLQTDDGWTRTIAITASTTITKGGATITVADLAVSDRIRFAQDRQSDGSYTVTRVVVVLPAVAGEVTAINGSTLTITQRGGTTATIHVDGDTVYRVNGQAGALSDIKVGSIVVAEGTQRADGSLDAAVVRSGFDHRGRDLKRDGVKPGASASPEPSSGAS